MCIHFKLVNHPNWDRDSNCLPMQSWGLFNRWITTGQISANNTRFGCPAVNVMISSPNINIFCSEAESNITVERSWLTIKYMRYSWLGTCRSSSVTILIQHYFVNDLLQTAQPLENTKKMHLMVKLKGSCYGGLLSS